MVSTIPSPADVMVALMLATPAVTAQVAQRVWAPELPDGQAASMPRKCIVLAPSGGAGLGADDYSDLSEPRFDIKCYGATWVEAQAVYREVYDLLKHVDGAVAAKGMIHTCAVESLGMMMRDAEGRWPMVLSVWRARVSEQEID